jgi:hypothetical protein
MTLNFSEYSPVSEYLQCAAPGNCVWTTIKFLRNWKESACFSLHESHKKKSIEVKLIICLLMLLQTQVRFTVFQNLIFLSTPPVTTKNFLSFHKSFRANWGLVAANQSRSLSFTLLHLRPNQVQLNAITWLTKMLQRQPPIFCIKFLYVRNSLRNQIGLILQRLDESNSIRLHSVFVPAM